jgi:protein polybromo-1
MFVVIKKYFCNLFFQYSDSEDDSADDDLSHSTSRTSKKFARSPRCLTRGKYLNNIPLKRRLYALCKCLMDYTVRIKFHNFVLKY